MITLHQFPPMFGVENPSPFCLKIETCLRIADIPFRAEVTDPRRAPKKKLPFITEENEVVADSTLILAYLQEKYGLDLNRHLTQEQKAIAQAFTIMMEDHFYWALVYSRWVGPNWPDTREQLARLLPPIIKALIPAVVRRQIVRDLHGQGLGRHQEEVIYRLANRDLKAVSDYLGDKPYFMGEEPCRFDATLYGMLGSMLPCNQDSPLIEYARSLPNLIEYQQRMEARFFLKTDPDTHAEVTTSRASPASQAQTGDQDAGNPSPQGGGAVGV